MERDEQLRSAAGYLEEASAGHGRLAYVAGEAGIGKTSYVAQVLADARGSARAVVGSCDGAATPAPLGPLVEVLPALPDHVWPPGATRQDVFARLVAVLRDRPGAGRTSSSSRTPTGPTRRPWTWCGTSPAASTTATRWCS